MRLVFKVSSSILLLHFPFMKNYFNFLIYEKVGLVSMKQLIKLTYMAL